MKSPKTRLISMLLCVAFLFTIWPVATFAIGSEELNDLINIFTTFADSLKSPNTSNEPSSTTESFAGDNAVNSTKQGSSLFAGTASVDVSQTIYNSYAAVFVNPTVTLYSDWYLTESTSITVNVTSSDIVKVEETYMMSDGSIIHQLAIEYSGDNEVLKEAIASDDFSKPLYRFVKDADIKEYNPEEPEQPVVPKVTVSGNLPENATVVSSNYSKDLDVPAGIDIFSIKVLDSNGDVWQPEPGETVQVSIPVSSAADTVTIVHFLEDPEIIKWAIDNGIAVAQDISMTIEDSNYYIFEPAVQAYQTAMGTTDICVVFEAFENVPIENGYATVNANGFSVFISVPPDAIVSGESSFKNLPEIVYVRPDEWIRCSVSGFIATINVRSDENGITTKISGANFSWLGESDTYIHVSEDASAGQSFKIYAWWNLFSDKEVTFIVVEDFDYGNVYIGVVGHDNPYPNELSVHSNASVDYYYYNDTLNTSKAVYCMNPDVMINLDSIKSSNLKVFNDSMTVYGVSDTTGSNANLFLRNTVSDENRENGMKPFSEIATEILTQYCNNNSLDPANYKVVPYVVKHETIGDDVGWYINCKIELKATYLLQYDYNFPEGYDVFDIVSGSKPQDTSIPTEGANDGVVEYTIGSFGSISIKTKLTNPSTNQEQEVTASLLGWSKFANSIDPEYKVGSSKYTIELSGNTTLYAVWELDVKDWEYKNFTWTIKNNLTDSYGTSIFEDDISGFTYTIDTHGSTFPLYYRVYSADGALVEPDSRSFEIDSENQTLFFTINGNQYIVIDSVPVKSNDNYCTYTIEQTETGIGFDVTTSQYELSTDSSIKISGTFTTTFTNIEQDALISYEVKAPSQDAVSQCTVTPTSQTVGVITGTPSSTAAVVGNEYRFVGWYSDESCNTLITKETKIEPEKNNNGLYVDATYYAKFEYNLTSLTISVSGLNYKTYSSYEDNESAIFQVSGNKGTFYIALSGESDSVTISGLTVGDTYTITEIDGWTWRYGTPTSTGLDSNNQIMASVLIGFKKVHKNTRFFYVQMAI